MSPTQGAAFCLAGRRPMGRRVTRLRSSNAERTTNEMTTESRKGPRGLSRRTLLKAGVGTAALFGALKTNFPAGVHIAEASGPEVTKANLGFIALTDAGALFAGKEKGFFAKHGMPG